MRIAVVVPCRDRLASLGLCLRSIAKAASALDATQHQIRTVVINDRSSPGFAATLARDFSWVEVIDNEGAGPGAARNTGLRHADADLYLLTDSDCVVAKDWCVRALAWSAERSAPMAQGVPWLYQKSTNVRLGLAEEQLYAHMFSSYVDGAQTSMIDPRCMLIARDYFQTHSRDVFATWIADASYEDRAVIGALIANGLRVDWRPDIRVYHEDPPDDLSAWRQKYRHGAGRVYRWREPPARDFLLQRYFQGPLAAAVDPAYAVPAHIAFLLGYRDNFQRRNPTAPDWWTPLAQALCDIAAESENWLAAVESQVSIPPRAPPVAAIKVAGFGVLAADHVFVADKNGDQRYHGSRGGGTVWNVLARLSQSGARTLACGAYATDGPGAQALAELRWLGIDTTALHATDGHTPTFTQWLNDDMRHGADMPQHQFTTDCPVCERPPGAFAAPDPRSVQLGDSALLCVDRLTPETARAARMARKQGALTAIDLGGVAGLAPRSRPRLLKDMTLFDLIAMPGPVATWLCGRPVDAFAKELIEQGASAVAITHGRDGFELTVRIQDDTITRRACVAAETNVADATGAGDAFLAALIAGALDPSMARADTARLGFRLEALDALASALQAAPLGVLGGVGARFGLCEHPTLTDWGSRLAPLRGFTLDELRRRAGGARPCWFCDLE